MGNGGEGKKIAEDVRSATRKRTRTETLTASEREVLKTPKNP